MDLNNPENPWGPQEPPTAQEPALFQPELAHSSSSQSLIYQQTATYTEIYTETIATPVAPASWPEQQTWSVPSPVKPQEPAIEPDNDSFRLEAITVSVSPEKAGFVFKHVNYAVKSPVLLLI